MAEQTTPQVALITGANTGIGRVTAEALAAQGYHCVLACRSEARTTPVLDAITAAGGSAEFLALDLGDLASVRDAAQRFLATERPLKLLINNAGVAGSRGLTASGFELAFGINHVGHFLLTHLLLPRLKQAAPARIVTVSSRAHYRAKRLDEQRLRETTRSLTATAEYGESKLANALFSAELGRRLTGTGVTTYALHPGVVATEIWRRVPWPVGALIKLAMIDAEAGARTTLHCATAPELAGETGLYYDRCKPREASALARDAALAKTLWGWSEAWVKPFV